MFGWPPHGGPLRPQLLLRAPSACQRALAGQRLFSPALAVADGKVKIPDGPGWGVTARALIAVGEQKVRVRVPADAAVRAVHLLAAGTSPRTERAGGWLTLTVPSVVDHEVIAVDL